MKKRIIIPIVLLVIWGVAFLSIQLYWFYNPEIEISNAMSETKTKEMIMVSYREKSIFGMSSSNKQQINEFCEKNDAIILMYHDLEGVYYVDADVVFSGNGMKIMYDVEAYTNGEREFSHFEDTVPFVLTKKMMFDGELISGYEAFELYKRVEDDFVENTLNIDEPFETVGVEELSMVMIDGKLYTATGQMSNIDMRCGIMDGEIVSSVESTEVPTENNQSNFGIGYGYQFGRENTIEIYIDGDWWVFKSED